MAKKRPNEVDLSQLPHELKSELPQQAPQEARQGKPQGKPEAKPPRKPTRATRKPTGKGKGKGKPAPAPAPAPAPPPKVSDMPLLALGVERLVRLPFELLAKRLPGEDVELSDDEAKQLTVTLEAVLDKYLTPVKYAEEIALALVLGSILGKRVVGHKLAVAQKAKEARRARLDRGTQRAGQEHSLDSAATA
jgi:hypothetical protein